MKTQEWRLVRRAAALKSTQKPLSMILINLHHLPHIEDPYFFRVIKTKIHGFLSGDEVEMFVLAFHRIAVFAEKARTRHILDQLAHFSAILVEHGSPGIETEVFEVSRRDGGFLARIRQLAAEAGVHEPDHADVATEHDAMDGDDSLSRFLVIERSLHSADLSSLVREQPVHDFTEPESPRVVASELSCSIDALEQMFGITIRRNPWLFDRVTEILDGRMFYHLIRDRSAASRPLWINMHLETILSDDFKTFVHEADFDWQERLVFELPYLDVKAHPALARRARERLDAYHATVALDDVPHAGLAEQRPDPARKVYWKVRWRDDLAGLAQADAEALAEDIGRLGADRVVLHHCPDREALLAGQGLGFRLIQGPGSDAEVKRLHDVEVEMRLAQARDRGYFAEMDQRTETPPPGGFLKNLLKR